MKHLNAEQMNAHLDGTLDPAELERVNRHLAECATCRNEFAAFASQDALLREALDHDPGKAYFEDFSARVIGRLNADESPADRSRAGADPARGGSSPWFAPRSIAWIGGALGALVVAAITFVQWSEHGTSGLESTRERSFATAPPAATPAESSANEASPAPLSDASRVLVGAPSVGATDPGTTVDEGAPLGGSAADQLQRQRAAQTGRALEVRRGENGEDVVVQRPGQMPPRAPQPAPTPGDQPAQALKPRYATPLAQAKAQQQELLKEGLAARSKDGRTEPQASSPEAAKREADSPAPAAERKLRKGVIPVTEETDAAAPGAPFGVISEGDVQRLCGTVRDVSGRPIPGAQVVLVELNRSVTAGPDGAFCLEAPNGSWTISALAVGFESRRVHVDRGLHANPMVVTLPAVSALGERAPSGRLTMRDQAESTTQSQLDANKRNTTLGLTQKFAPGDVFATLPADARALAGTALDQTERAEKQHSAALFDQAARTWSNVLAGNPPEPASGALRWRLAQARTRAWQLDPTEARLRDARAAVTAFLARAPRGAERDTASRWQQRFVP